MNNYFLQKRRPVSTTTDLLHLNPSHPRIETGFNHFTEGRGRTGLLLLFFLFLTVFQVDTIAQTQTNARAQWFVDSRYGMFIHWGVYSGAEGFWKGEKLRYDNNYAEWIYYRNRISKDEYVTLLDRFDWNRIKPEEWVVLAKKAGMKYVTLTAKHHDGFALWNSKASNYNIAHYTSPQRDIVAELAAACRKHGLKLGIYYSHWIDWEHPDSWDHSKEIYGASKEGYDRYWQQKVIPQMTELLTNYGEIALFWFDMWVDHKETVVTKEQLLQLKNLIRTLQPNCLVNSRLGLSLEEDPDIDFKTLGDNEIGSKKEDFPWQSPATVAHSWGYFAHENRYKATTILLQELINTASLNGCYLLNIGPRANGEVPAEVSQRLLSIGDWLARNGESVYNTQAFELKKEQNDWGRITCRTTKEGKTRLYLHLYNIPLNRKLYVNGITTPPVKAYPLGQAQKKNYLDVTFSKAITTLDLSRIQADPLVTVIVLEYNNYPSTNDQVIGKCMEDGYQLNGRNLVTGSTPVKIEPAGKFGSIPGHISISSKGEFTWKIIVPEPTTLTADLSCSYQGDGKIPCTLEAAGQKISQLITKTGMTVGEPNENWHIESYNSIRCGKIKFNEAGEYTLRLHLDPPKGETVNFQWIWLSETR